MALRKPATTSTTERRQDVYILKDVWEGSQARASHDGIPFPDAIHRLIHEAAEGNIDFDPREYTGRPHRDSYDIHPDPQDWERFQGRAKDEHISDYFALEQLLVRYQNGDFLKQTPTAQAAADAPVAPRPDHPKQDVRIRRDYWEGAQESAADENMSIHDVIGWLIHEAAEGNIEIAKRVGRTPRGNRAIYPEPQDWEKFQQRATAKDVSYSRAVELLLTRHKRGDFKMKAVIEFREVRGLKRTGARKGGEGEAA